MIRETTFTCECEQCGEIYTCHIEDSTVFCPECVERLIELRREDDEWEEREDTGHYENGYRVYRDGSYREDFGSDR